MKICPRCNCEVADEAAFCAKCGAAFGQDGQPVSQQYTPVYDVFDHTAEFDAKDISDNKVFAMLCYLMGAIGIIIALLASRDSQYVKFHLRQALKIMVVEILAPICLIVCAIVCIIPILGWIVYILAALAYLVLACALFVIKIISFFQICKGKAKEAAIVRSLNFLK